MVNVNGKFHCTFNGTFVCFGFWNKAKRNQKVSKMFKCVKYKYALSILISDFRYFNKQIELNRVGK